MPTLWLSDVEKLNMRLTGYPIAMPSQNNVRSQVSTQTFRGNLYRPFTANIKKEYEQVQTQAEAALIAASNCITATQASETVRMLYSVTLKTLNGELQWTFLDRVPPGSDCPRSPVQATLPNGNILTLGGAFLDPEGKYLMRLQKNEDDTDARFMEITDKAGELVGKAFYESLKASRMRRICGDLGDRLEV